MKTISVPVRILHEKELDGIYGMLLFADFFYNWLTMVASALNLKH